MIKSIRHKGLKQFWTRGQTKGLIQDHVKRLARMLDVLDAARTLDALDLPGYHLHSLKGTEKGRYSIRVSGNWRLTFEFEDGDVHVLDYEDYH
ncbi:MAG: type II toxin-antitoxin system RelE/ParE family toxin [Litorimonas sp.]